MKFPKGLTEGLKEGIIAEELADAVLLKLTTEGNALKTAYGQPKDYETLEAQLKSFYDQKDQKEKLKKAEEGVKLLEKKKLILSNLEPVCIHRATSKYESSAWDYGCPGFLDALAKGLCEGTITGSRSLFEPTKYYPYEEVTIEDINKPIEFVYYLFYRVGLHGYHIPISADEVSTYNLPVYDYADLNLDDKSLVPVCPDKICADVLDLIGSGEYELRAACMDPSQMDRLRKEAAALTPVSVDRKRNIGIGLSIVRKHFWGVITGFGNDIIADSTCDSSPVLTEEQKRGWDCLRSDLDKRIQGECEKAVEEVNRFFGWTDSPRRIWLHNEAMVMLEILQKIEVSSHNMEALTNALEEAVWDAHTNPKIHVQTMKELLELTYSKGVIPYGCAYRLSIVYCEKRLQEVKDALGIPVLEEKLKALIADLEDQYPESKKFRKD